MVGGGAAGSLMFSFRESPVLGLDRSSGASCFTSLGLYKLDLEIKIFDVRFYINGKFKLVLET